MARICTELAIPVQQQGLPFPLATGREAQEHMEHPEGSVVFQYACNMLSRRGWARAIDPDARRTGSSSRIRGARRKAGGRGGLAAVTRYYMEGALTRP